MSIPYEHLENFDCGVTRGWLRSGAIVVFAIPNVAHATVDMWGEVVLKTVKAWDPSVPFLAMHDVSAKGCGLTPLVRSWSQRLAHASAHLKGSYTVILPDTLMSNVIRIFIDSSLRRVMPSFDSRTFLNANDGVTWLLEQADLKVRV